MLALWLVLAPIGLLDSTSIVPLCLVILIAVLAGPRPFLASSAHVLGVFGVYLGCGLLVLFGLQSVFDEINQYAARLWNEPKTEELIFQILIGFVACGFSYRIARMSQDPKDGTARAGMTPGQAFAAGAGLTIVGMPAAVPYLAAIDLVLRAELGLAQQVLTLAYYNLVFVAPLVAIVALSLSAGERSLAVLGKVRAVLDEWGKRVVVWLLVLLGVVLIVDGIGWFLGFPIIPVGTS